MVKMGVMTNKAIRKVMCYAERKTYKADGTNWHDLYEAVYEKTGADYEKVVKGTGVSVIDYIETAGCLPELAKVAEDVFGYKILDTKAVIEAQEIDEKTDGWVTNILFDNTIIFPCFHVWGVIGHKTYDEYQGRYCIKGDDAYTQYINDALSAMKDASKEEIAYNILLSRFEYILCTYRLDEKNLIYVTPKHEGTASWEIAADDYLRGNKTLGEAIAFMAQAEGVDIPQNVLANTDLLLVGIEKEIAEEPVSLEVLTEKLGTNTDNIRKAIRKREPHIMIDNGMCRYVTCSDCANNRSEKQFSQNELTDKCRYIFDESPSCARYCEELRTKE